MTWVVVLLAAQESTSWIEVLRRGDVEDRRRAEQGLLGAGPGVRQALAALHEDPDPEVRSAARRIVEVIDLREFLPASVTAAMPGALDLLADGRWQPVLRELARKTPDLPAPDARVAGLAVFRTAQRLGEIRDFCTFACEWRARCAIPAVALICRDADEPLKNLASAALQMLAEPLCHILEELPNPRRLSLELRIALFASPMGGRFELPFLAPPRQVALVDGLVVEAGSAVPHLGLRVRKVGARSVDFAPLD